MRNLNIKPSEALPSTETIKPAHGHRGSFYRSLKVVGVNLDTSAHEYGAVRQVLAHLRDAEWDRAFVLRWSDRVLVDFSKTTTDEDGTTLRSTVGATISKAEARQLRDRLNGLDLDDAHEEAR